MGYKQVLAAFYRGVLSARYRVRLEGVELLTEKRATVVFAESSGICRSSDCLFSVITLRGCVSVGDGGVF